MEFVAPYTPDSRPVHSWMLLQAVFAWSPPCPQDEFSQGQAECQPDAYGSQPRTIIQRYEAACHMCTIDIPVRGGVVHPYSQVRYDNP